MLITVLIALVGTAAIVGAAGLLLFVLSIWTDWALNTTLPTPLAVMLSPIGVLGEATLLLLFFGIYCAARPQNEVQK